MAAPTLTPVSTISATRLSVTGAHANVDSSDNPLPFGIYTTGLHPDSDFISGSVDQVAYVYKKLGGDVLDVELTEYQVYTAYEEAVLEYSYLVNIHQAKNSLSDYLGGTTGSFDEDGEMVEGTSTSKNEVKEGDNVNLKYPKYTFSYARNMAEGVAEAANIGGTQTIYSASIARVNSQQDYDLQTLIENSASSESDLPFSNSNLGSNQISTNRILIKKVYYKTPQAMWRFYGYYGGLNTVGNLANYGQFADDSTFEIIPAWQNKLQAKGFEDSLYTRMSHFSYEVKNNKLRLFPAPHEHSPEKFWVEFTVKRDAWEEDADRQRGAEGINNMNTLPFPNIPYKSINSIGKQWIRRFCLSLCKEMLGQVRSKFATIPIPGETVTLNGTDLISQAKEEQDKLREELKTTLDEITYQRLAEKDASLADSTNKVMQSIPVPVFVG